MEELKLHLEYGKTLAYVSVIAATITITTHLIFKRNRYIKYLPGLIFIAIGFYNLISINDITSRQSITNFLLMIMGFGGGIIGLFTGLIIGIWNKPRKVKPQ